ncbi:MAG: hypothetical protein RMN52_09580 [Anaerolineae bacterium]|nr:hypothetical protein [Candidatus Roseilinea sp.]MDW8450243.1 hypothetical protein [Anaerolineae bacterium]
MKGPADEARVLRGGAFNNNTDNVRCANRDRNNPNNRNDNNGFRVCALHIFPREMSDFFKKSDI